MERIKIKLIKKLEFNIKKDKKKALEDFLELLNKEGSPIIEEIEEDSNNSLVTFFYFSKEKINNVLIIAPVLGALNEDNIEDYLLEEIYDTNLWYRTYKIRNDIKFSYNLFPNDSLLLQCSERIKNIKYDNLNKNKLIFDRPNSFKFETAYVNMPNCDKNFWTEERVNIPKGNLKTYDFKNFYFTESRQIKIYTPPGYSEDSEPYPFIVLTDAYDYLNILKAENVLNNLISDKKIPKVVAIFIESTDKRHEDLTCNEIFCDSVANEMIPWLRKKYNLSEDPQKAIIGGVSLGGLTATYMGLNDSNVFGNVICNSGSFWYKPKSLNEENKEQNKNIVNEIDCFISKEIKSKEKLNLKFYISVGVNENKETMINTNLNVKESLETLGYKVDFNFFKSGHDYLSWGEELAKGLISIIGCN